jgi:hypothetical protein
VVEEALLEDGDRVSFGDVQAVFYFYDAPTTDALEVPDIAPAPMPVPRPLPVVEVIEPLVHSVSATGVPRGMGADPDRHYRDKPKRRRVYSEGSGCGTAFLLLILFGGAFVMGLIMRHHKATNGNGSLFKDIVDRILPAVKIEIKQQPL